MYIIMWYYSIILLSLVSYFPTHANKSFYKCQPLLSNEQKEKTLSNFRLNGSSPLLFWHIHKSGGTSFCDMAMNEYKSINKMFSSVNCNGPWEKLISNSNGINDIWNNNLYKIGYRMMAMEPAHMPMRKSFEWPSVYHKKANKFLLQSPYYKRIWEEIVHVIVIRNPIQRALSAFSYKKIYPPTTQKESFVTSCEKYNITLNNCLIHAIEINLNIDKYDKLTSNRWLSNEKPPNLITDNVFTLSQITVLNRYILNDFLLDHLSVNKNMTQAKINLKKFFLIIDFSDNEASLFFLQCVLGWKSATKTLHSNSNKVNTNKLLSSEITNDTLTLLKQYLARDIELYQYAFSLMNNHYNNIKKYIQIN